MKSSLLVAIGFCAGGLGLAVMDSNGVQMTLYSQCNENASYGVDRVQLYCRHEGIKAVVT